MRHLRIELRRRCWPLAKNALENDSSCCAGERRSAGSHLIQNGTKGKKIRTCINVLATRLFRRHVGDSSNGRAGTGQKFFWQADGGPIGAPGWRRGGSL